MKKLLLLLLLAPVISYCQSDYSNGYKQGYCSGCNKAKGYSDDTPCTTTRFREGVGGYRQGYSDGYSRALNECRPTTSSYNNQRSQTNGNTYSRSYNQAKSGIDAFNSSFDNVVSSSSTSSRSNSLASDYNQLVDKYNALLEKYSEKLAYSEYLYNLGIERDKELMGVIESIKEKNLNFYEAIIAGCDNVIEGNNKRMKSENISQREIDIHKHFNETFIFIKEKVEAQMETLSN